MRRLFQRKSFWSIFSDLRMPHHGALSYRRLVFRDVALPSIPRSDSLSYVILVVAGPIWALARAHDWSGRAGLAAHNSLSGGTRRSGAAFSIERASATWSPGVGPGFSRSYEPRGNARVTRFSGGHYNQ